MAAAQFDRNRLWNIFRQIDRNGDRTIDATELQMALRNGSWAPFNPETVRLMIGLFDYNRNGTIDFDEFCHLWKYVTDWAQTFRNYDLDKNGSIDQNELKQAMHGFGFRISDQIIAVLMRRFDRTGTGVVQFDDFIQLCVVVRLIDGGKTTKSLPRFEFPIDFSISPNHKHSSNMDESVKFLKEVFKPYVIK